jgi:hypothetical protein
LDGAEHFVAATSNCASFRRAKRRGIDLHDFSGNFFSLIRAPHAAAAIAVGLMASIERL